MRFDRATISLAPRSTKNCLDLAVVFLRRYFLPLTALWATVAVPACSLTWYMLQRFDGTMYVALAMFCLATSPLGILIVAGAAPCAFGEPFTWRGTWARLGIRGFGLFSLGLLLRAAMGLGFVTFLFPGWYIAVRSGFFAEQSVLSRLDRHLHDRRTNELLKGEIGDLFQRSAGLVVFCGLLWFVLLVTVDFASARLLGIPILWGRVTVDTSYLGGFMESVPYLMDFLWSDPVVVTAALACALYAYVIGRLAWFFCYIDVRVRRDCWDMELAILQEARRLETAGAE